MMLLENNWRNVSQLMHKGGVMKMKHLRVRIPDDLFKRYKHVCVDMLLTLPKQTAELIRHFVEVQEKNLNSIKK